MGREFDIRTQSSPRSLAVSRSEIDIQASDLSDELAGSHRVRVTRSHALTGRPTTVASDNAPEEQGNYVQRALDHVASLRSVFGFAPSQPAEFLADPHVQRTSSGAASVHLKQHFKSLPIFQASETVRFGPDGAIKETKGNAIVVDDDKSTEPSITAADAVRIAAHYIAVPEADEVHEKDQFGEALVQVSVDVSAFEPTMVATFHDKPDRTTIFEPGPFDGRLTASLIWFDIHGDLRLAWQTNIAMPQQQGQYLTIIDADSSEVLYCKQLMHLVAARGHVFQIDGSETRQMVDFPRPLADYGIALPASLPNGFPDDWVSDDQMVGNSVRAHLLDDGPTFSGTNDNGTIVFDPADPNGEEQQVLNIFYYNCYMHDFFYLLGFTEVDGNFQESNLGRGGLDSDNVDARAHPMPIFGTANMRTPPDGRNPTMNMGLVGSTGRHTALDSSVVYHEFSHGVTNRLVGGRMDSFALNEPQSGGMGEGWGDYFACTINETTVVGSWVVNNPQGIRGFPYDSNFPDHFGMLGTGRYTGVHNIGEIWCATLMEMTRTIGRTLATQLVVDALKLSPANPSFLDMRDAILDGLDDKLGAGQLNENEHRQVKIQIWTVFARFGMGPNAASNGASLFGIVADFEPPVIDIPTSIVAEASPDLVVPDDDATGVSHQLQIQTEHTIGRLVVSIDIEHTYIGDLIVDLEGPTGQVARLHNRSGRSTDNLVRAYAADNTVALSTFVGTPAQGSWTLRISDLAGIDTGRLKHWRIEIEPQQLIA